jgi:hypothetical protein
MIGNRKLRFIDQSLNISKAVVKNFSHVLRAERAIENSIF